MTFENDVDIYKKDTIIILKKNMKKGSLLYKHFTFITNYRLDI